MFYFYMGIKLGKYVKVRYLTHVIESVSVSVIGIQHRREVTYIGAALFKCFVIL